MNVSDRRLCAYVYFDIWRITQVGIRSRSLTGLSNVDSGYVASIVVLAQNYLGQPAI